jgi:hypothetical protein
VGVWNQPPTLTDLQAVQKQTVPGVVGSGGFSILPGVNIESARIQGNFDLRRNLFVLPPHGVAVFETTLEFRYRNKNGGEVQIDFNGGDFSVMCPGIVIEIPVEQLVD